MEGGVGRVLAPTAFFVCVWAWARVYASGCGQRPYLKFGDFWHMGPTEFA